MNQDVPSMTALVCTLARAIHTRRDPEPIFEVPWGDLLVPNNLKDVLPKAAVAALGSDHDSALDDWIRANAFYSVLLTRSRYTEDALRSAISRGTSQYVVLGARRNPFTLVKDYIGGQVSREIILEHLYEMVRICRENGSPFTAQLVEKISDDFDTGGPTRALLGEWPTNPRADFLALRLAGALHAAALTERDSALANAYPPRNTIWGMEDLWPIARTFLQRESAWVTQFLKSPPQTNETGRSIALLAGFLFFADQWDGPVDMLEIGASAGLNLIWDKFAYQTHTWSWGSPGSVVIEADWQGPAPPTDAQLRIRSKAACDLNPLDIRIPEERLRLRSYIWPDQPDRLARFDGAVALALESGVEVERANAAEWLLNKLSARALDAATIVYHSVFLQYPPKEAREDIVRAIYGAGAAATSKAPLAWVRVEPEALVDGVAGSKRFTIDLTVWPGGIRRILGYTDGHGRVVHAV